MRRITSATVCALAVLALGLSAGSAQALTHDWAIWAEGTYEGGKAGMAEAFAELGLSEENVAVIGGKAFKISVPSLKSTLECKKTEGSGSLTKGGANSLKVTLTSCKILENELCKVTEPVVFSAKTELVLVENRLYEKMVPATSGKPFATVGMTGFGCLLGKEVEVTGAVATEMPIEPLSLQQFRMSEAISKKVNEGLAKEGKAEYKLEAGKAAATVDAELLVKLSGAHAGESWQDSPETVLCETSGVATCTAAKAYARGTTVKIESEAASKFTYDVTIAPNPPVTLEVSCQTVKFEGKTSTVLYNLAGNLTTVKYEECGGCSVTKAVNPLFRFTTGVPLAPGNGNLSLYTMIVKILCQGKTCEYALTSTFSPIVFDLTGGAPAKAQRAASVAMTRVDAGSDAGVCSAFGTWQGVAGAGGVLKFKFPSPNPLYVTLFEP